jgi:hypothetical protein
LSVNIDMAVVRLAWEGCYGYYNKQTGDGTTTSAWEGCCGYYNKQTGDGTATSGT